MKIVTYNSALDDFLLKQLLIFELEGVEVILSTQSYVEVSGTKSSGFFLDNPPTFAVAIGRPLEEWLPIFVHESSHFDQWNQEDPLWLEMIEANNNSGEDEDAMFQWISGKDLSPEIIADIFRTTKAVEFDCEKRSLAKIQKYSLPIDIKKYARMSNVYVAYYDFMQKHRYWSEVPICTREETMSVVSDELTDLPVLSQALEEAIQKIRFEQKEQVKS